MSDVRPYVPTRAIREAVRGREGEILKALSIDWDANGKHIRCPYPDHDDMHPSWRWDPATQRAHCTCTTSVSIFDVVSKVRGLDFRAARIWVAETLGRPDLTISSNERNYQHADAAALLSPVPDNQDDTLPWNYLAYRLGVEPECVPRPTTKDTSPEPLRFAGSANGLDQQGGVFAKSWWWPWPENC
jgi:hypothetical protein